MYSAIRLSSRKCAINSVLIPPFPFIPHSLIETS